MLPTIPGTPVQSQRLTELRIHMARLFGMEVSDRREPRFPGAQPVSFNKSHLSLLEEENFFVSEKADGIRCLLITTKDPLTGQPETFLVDRKNAYYKINLPLPKPEDINTFQNDTVLDGELVLDVDHGVEILWFLLFDCMILMGQSLIDKPFTKRLGRLKEFVVKPFQQLYRQDRRYRDSLPFRFDVKPLQLSYHVGQVFEMIPKLKHKNDGVIFTSSIAPYAIGTCQKMLKWKPSEENTVDFKLDGPDIEGRYTISLWKGGKDGHLTRKLTLFPKAKLTIANRWYYNPPGYGKIIECRYDPNWPGQWRFSRFRDDKENANHETVYFSIMDSIRDNVEQSEIVEHAASKQSATTVATLAGLDRVIEQLQTAKASLEGGGSGGLGSVKTLPKQILDEQKKTLDAHKDLHTAAAKFNKAVDKRFKVDWDQMWNPDALSTKKDTLNDAIVRHLVREGRFDLARTFAVEAVLPQQPADSLTTEFTDMYTILSAIKLYNLDPAIAWVQAHANALNDIESDLEFLVVRLQFLKLLFGVEGVVKGDRELALAYAKDKFGVFRDAHMKEIQKLMCCLLYTNKISSSPYKNLTDSTGWSDLSHQFTRDFCLLLHLPAESPLHTCVSVGVNALPTIIKMSSILKEQSGLEWSTQGELPVEIPLLDRQRFHSVFACPVSKELGTKENPPMIYESKYGPAAIPDGIDVHNIVFSSDKKNSNATALIDAVSGAKVTYKELLGSIDALAAALYGSLEFKKWNVVGIFSPNHMQFPTVVHAVLKAGGTVSPVNPTYNDRELAYQLKDSGARFLFAHPSFLTTALAAARHVGIPEDRIILFDDPSVTYPGPTRRTINQISKDNKKPLPTVKFTRPEITEKPAYLCYSSGTTGLSKGVETTQSNVIANILQYDAYHKKAREVFSGDVWTAVLPMFHIYGLTLSLHVAFHQSCSVVVFPKFDLPLFLSSLQKYNVTGAHIVPPIALALAKHPMVDKFKFPKLRGLMSGAAPLAPEIVEEVWKRLKIPLYSGYGMTETSPITHMLPSALATKFPGSIGHLVPSVEARLVNPDTGADIPIDGEGELWVRGPNIMKGYHNNAKSTTETIDKDGWLHTGDIAKVNEQGLFYIVDRLKELIKYKGFQVAPAELEAYLLEHPQVADSAVIGRADEAGGEVPRAFIVLQPNSKVTEQEIIEFIDKKVAPHKRLRGGVEFVKEIPKAASGKILRRILRNQDAVNVKKASKL
ncbi:UNVERIFIED_CONTAM: putative fatty-acid--CoA ligase FadD10 [Siphonaria sp. JEL0065]|nr:putative fatty-acid--CoA ligase FadD10 [Siphonaria sp. JEL0065]